VDATKNADFVRGALKMLEAIALDCPLDDDQCAGQGVAEATADLPRTNGSEAYYTVRIAPPDAPPVKVAAPAAPMTAPDAAGEPFAVKLGEKDISILAGTAGTFSIKYPALVKSGDKL